MKHNRYLIIGGVISLIASLLHVLIIIGGPDWYRFFGAGEGMAQLAEKDSTYPSIITGVIALILALWALYAFSGAGIISRFPLLKPVLLVISAIFITRGVFGIPVVILIDQPYLNELEEKIIFMIFSSLVSLCIGLFYLVGLIEVWKSNLHYKASANE
ncbi:MAG: hypothetical protein H0U27_13800 [Nitrosopumilus sp.]|nr:hypothetical protein [Nitrosopumilus sp.]